MRGVKTSMKISLIGIALALLACLVALRSQRDEPFAAIVSDTSQGPSFKAHVKRPLLARPLFGLFGSNLCHRSSATV